MAHQPDRTTVLIADDDDDMRALVRLHLELSGDFDVVAEAVDGVDALAAFDDLGGPPVPDVVLVDNRMPHMTGLELAGQLIERVPTQRIVLFTAFADDEAQRRCDELGVLLLSKDQVAQLPSVVRGLAK